MWINGTGKKLYTKDQSNIAYLKDTVNKIWKVIKGAENLVLKQYPTTGD